MPTAGSRPPKRGCTGCIVFVALFFVIGILYAIFGQNQNNGGTPAVTPSGSPYSQSASAPSNTK